MRPFGLLCGLLAACSLVAEDLPRGKVVDRVVCRENERQSYALYLPSSYAPERKWPVVYCLDPMARGRAPLERFAAAAEKAGYLLVGSNNSRNGPFGPIQEAVAAMVADTHARLSIDDDRVYAAGFSGGGQAALSWAHAARLAGAVICSSSPRAANLPSHRPFRMFATAGMDDLSYHDMYAASVEMAKRGVEHRFVVLEGGHDWLTPAAAEEAFQFFEGRLPIQAATASKEERKQAELLEKLTLQLGHAEEGERYVLAKRLLKDSAAPTDTPERRLARQVLGSTYIASMEEARGCMERKEYAAAANLWELGVLVRPTTSSAWYSLAVAQAAAGNKGRALEALKQAVAHGFKDAAKMEQEPLLAEARRDRRYRAVADSISAQR